MISRNVGNSIACRAISYFGDICFAYWAGRANASTFVDNARKGWRRVALNEEKNKDPNVSRTINEHASARIRAETRARLEAHGNSSSARARIGAKPNQNPMWYKSARTNPCFQTAKRNNPNQMNRQTPRD